MREIAKDIIEKAADGDMAAFEEIYRTFSSSVYTIALGVTRNREDAEEATQDVFVRAFRNLKGFRFGSSFGTWIYRITMNVSLNTCRRRARRGAGSVSYDDFKNVLPAAPDTAGKGAEREDAAGRVAELLKNISPEHRSCIVLREIEGLDYKEMADVLAIPINTVRSRLKRAREALMAYCRKEGIGHAL